MTVPVADMIKDVMDHAYGKTQHTTEAQIRASMKRYPSTELLRIVVAAHAQAQCDTNEWDIGYSLTEIDIDQMQMSILLLGCAGAVLAERACECFV